MHPGKKKTVIHESRENEILHVKLTPFAKCIIIITMTMFLRKSLKYVSAIAKEKEKTIVDSLFLVND